MSEDRDAGNLPDEQEPDDLDDLVEEPDADEAEPAADLGDEPEGNEPADEPPAPTAKRPGRRERQSAELRELRERVERQERELQSVRGQQQQPRVDNSAELARVAAYERDQLPLLTTDQQISYWRQKDRQEIGGYLQRQEAALADRLDRSAWQTICSADPVARQFSDEVERTIAAMPPGETRQREVVFDYLFGKHMRAQRAKSVGKQRQAAQRRVRSQTTQPGGSRSDVARDRQPAATGQDYEGAMARMRGKALW